MNRFDTQRMFWLICSVLLTELGQRKLCDQILTLGEKIKSQTKIGLKRSQEIQSLNFIALKVAELSDL